MSLVQKDLMVRMIQQLAEVFGRVVGLKRQGRLDEAEELLRQTSTGLFGPIWDTLERLEPSSATMMLSAREKVSAYAMLTQHAADLDDLRGNVWKGQKGHKRALELHLEAARLGSEVDAATRAAIRTLRGRVDEGRLSKSYKVLLDRIAGPR